MNQEARRCRRRPDPRPRLLQGLVRQPHDREGTSTIPFGDVGFDLDRNRIESDNGVGACVSEHGSSLSDRDRHASL